MFEFITGGQRTWWFALVVAASFVALAHASDAQAHALRIFASVEGTKISGRVYFDGNDPAAGVSVQILGPKGEPIAELITDKDGRFQHSVLYRADYLLVAETSDLHRAEAKIRSTEFATNLASIDVEPHVQEVVDQAKQEELRGATGEEYRQLKEQLDRLEHSMGLRDIIGGVGFILFLLAIVSFLKRRSR